MILLLKMPFSKGSAASEKSPPGSLNLAGRGYFEQILFMILL